MKNILLTGSSGFIGRNLKEQMSKSNYLLAPNSKELDLLDSTAVMNFFCETKVDIVIHAANTRTTKNQNITAYDSLDRNLRMFFNLERCKGLFDKMYYFGSGAEYDLRNYTPEMTEEYFDTYVPKEPYGFSKYIMSKICDRANNIYDLRLFGVFGKYEEWERRFISNAICRALKGKPITIQRNVYFDYLWVDDLVKIMEWFIDSAPDYKVYNVCRGKKIDLYSLACLVRKILGIECDIIVKEPGWKMEYSGNNKRLLNEMGGFNFTDFETSIKILGEYYRKNINEIDETLL